MNDFTFYSPTYFVFGKDTEQQAGELVKRFGGTKALLHYGGGSVKRSGLLDRVKKSLDQAKVDYVELGGVVPNPRDTLVYEGIELCRKEGVDFLLPVGGGSVIDSAKAIAVGVPYDGDFWEVYCKLIPCKAVLPVGTILTLPGTGSEGSNSSVISRDEGNLKYGYSSDKIRPTFSILNPELTYTLSPYQTACGITDMMAHVLERYLTNTRDVDLTDRLCEGLLKAIMYQAPRVLEDPEDYGARANIMWAGMVAHNNAVGVGRDQDWSSHAMEHELSAYYDVAHGAGLAVVLPAFMDYTLHHDVMRYAQLAVRVFDCDMDFQNPERTAKEGISRFRAFLKSIGMPLTFADLGADPDDIPMMAASTRMKGKARLGQFMPLDRQDIEAVFRLCV